MINIEHVLRIPNWAAPFRSCYFGKIDGLRFFLYTAGSFTAAKQFAVGKKDRFATVLRIRSSGALELANIVVEAVSEDSEHLMRRRSWQQESD